MAECPHWLELDTGVPNTAPRVIECEGHLNHKKKHYYIAGGQAVGPRPRGGQARKPVGVRIEWDR